MSARQCGLITSVRTQSVVFAIKFVDVISYDPDGLLDIGRTVVAAVGAIGVARDRIACSFVIGVAVDPCCCSTGGPVRSVGANTKNATNTAISTNNRPMVANHISVGDVCR